MKTVMKLKQMMAICVALFTFSSCLNSEDPAFQIASTAFVYQTTTRTQTGSEEFEDNVRYVPYFQVYSNYQMSQCMCTSSNGSAIFMSPMSNSQKLVYESSTSNYSTQYPAGTYTFTATNSEGEQTTTTTSIKESDPLGYINVTELKYEGGKITAKWDKVTNATAYAVAIGKAGEILPRYTKEFESYPESGVNFDFSNETAKLEAGTYKLYVIAYLISNNQLMIMSPSQTQETITVE